MTTYKKYSSSLRCVTYISCCQDASYVRISASNAHSCTSELHVCSCEAALLKMHEMLNKHTREQLESDLSANVG